MEIVTQQQRRRAATRITRRTVLTALLCAAVGSPAAFAQEAAPVPSVPEPGIELAFCIDVSGSMTGNMRYAKRAVAQIVREVAAGNPDTPIRLGLMRYGDGDRNYYVLPLTENRRRFFSALDDTYVQPCGAEFFGAVIERASDKLGWSEEKATTKLLYVVGNETAEQGSKNYREIVPKVVAKGISVSTLYCPYQSLQTRRQRTRHGYSALGRNATNSSSAAQDLVQAELDQKITWVDAARLGGGEYLQLNYRSGPSEPLVLAWEPGEFVKTLERMGSPEYLAQLTQDRALDQVDAMLSDAIVQGWMQKAQAAQGAALRSGFHPSFGRRPGGSGSGLVGRR